MELVVSCVLFLDSSNSLSFRTFSRGWGDDLLVMIPLVDVALKPSIQIVY